MGTFIDFLRNIYKGVKGSWSSLVKNICLKNIYINNAMQITSINIPNNKNSTFAITTITAFVVN